MKSGTAALPSEFGVEARIQNRRAILSANAEANMHVGGGFSRGEDVTEANWAPPLVVPLEALSATLKKRSPLGLAFFEGNTRSGRNYIHKDLREC